MKKFQFKLQKLLDLREMKEQEVKNELAALLNIQNRERLRQDEYRAKIQKEQDRFSKKMRSGDFSYNESLMFERFIEFSNRVIATAQDRIDSMEAEIDKVRQKLVEASREKKVVDRLKERKYEKYLYEVNRDIAKENDDMNQKIYMRQKLSEMG